MKKNKFKTLALATLLFGSTLASPAALAVKPDPYGINYFNQNGVELSGSLVKTINTGKMNNLLKVTQGKLKTVFGQGWQFGNIQTTHTCIGGAGYIYIEDDNDIKEFTEENPLIATITDEVSGISLEINFKKIQTKGLTYDANRGGVVLYLTGQSFNLAASRKMYKQKYDASTGEAICSQKAGETETNFIDGIATTDWDEGEGALFAEMVTKIKDKDGNTISHDGIYFGFSDIDSSQSYEILSTDNMFVSGPSGNMYSTDVSMLQPKDTTLRNKFVAASGDQPSYIYSEYKAKTQSEPGEEINIDTNHIYVPLKKNVQEDGLHVVFGFGTQAYSTIEYYAYNFTIAYKSDTNGTITGKKDEEVYPNENPSGTTVVPSEGYTLSYWTANKDVTLIDGATIEAGKPITAEQLKQVVVNEDITFTAIHDKAVLTPDTGFITKEDNGATIVSLSLAGIVIAAILSFCLPRISHKKMGFRK